MSVFKKQRMEVVGEKMFNVAIRLGFCFSRKKKKNCGQTFTAIFYLMQHMPSMLLLDGMLECLLFFYIIPITFFFFFK
jgi:hypothetical protein